MAFPETMFNNSYGRGFEGFLNYSNSLVDGWMVNLFLAFIFIASTYTLSKSEWSMPGVVAFSLLVCFISALIIKLITPVNELVIFIIGILLAISIGWGIITKYV